MNYLGNGLDHRWGERVRVNVPVRVSAAGLMRMDACVENLSLSGALVRCDYELRLHALIKVRIELAPPGSLTGLVEAHVSRIAEDRVGIEWCEFAPGIVKDLLREPSVRFPAERAWANEQTGSGGEYRASR
jgi:PilZ domain